MRTKSIAIVVLGGVLAALVAWRALDGSPKRAIKAAHAAEQADPAAAPDPAVAMQAQLDNLQARVLELQQQVADGHASAAAVASVAAALSARPAANEPAPDSAEEHRRMKEHLDEVVADFEAEPRDEHWGRERTAEFQGWLAKSDLLKKAFQNLECRSSMCRVEMLDDRSQKFFAQLTEMVASVGQQLPTVTGQRKTRPDGTEIAVYYFSKEGG